MPEPASIQLDLSRGSCECHILPCSINYEGPVDESKFPIETSPQLFTRLRGRPLHGRAVDLAAYGYGGVCVRHTEAEDRDVELDELDGLDGDEAPERAPRLAQDSDLFESIVVWEHGRAPAEDDAWAGRLEELLKMSATMEELQSL